MSYILTNTQAIAAMKGSLSMMSTSKVTGCAISINGGDNSKFDISAGKLQFVDNYTDIDAPVFTEYTYAGSTANTVTNLATANVTYISMDVNGTITQSVIPPNDGDLRDNVILGVVTHPNHTSLTSADSRTTVPPTGTASTLGDFYQAIGLINFSGNVFGPNGANLKINKSSGQSFGLGINYSINKKDPNLTTDASAMALTFVYLWRDGAGGSKTYVSDTIQPAYYDDDTVGSTTHPNGAVSTNQWTIMPIRFYPASDSIVINSGQAAYSSYANALAGMKNIVEVLNAPTGIIRSWLLIRGGATDLSNTADAVFIEANKFGMY